MVCNNEHEEICQKKNVEIKEIEYTCARSVSGRTRVKSILMYHRKSSNQFNGWDWSSMYIKALTGS